MPANKRSLSEPDVLPHLKYIEGLVGTGYCDITLGRIENHPCVATAADEDQQLAMLVRRKGESLAQLLIRLDKAIEGAYEHQIFINEVYDGPT
ncbi:hypothetical protein [Solimonas sp. SE-A11]|uniref:hypothetical protein n=1 Tax=Solimonas sp. SE-A11 TaxID=3054954 RepID=UPI00259C7976|nr:hypothetical protein [Solimonas sp. SE-A11]MDM4771484.1 hypothetical protein [Solimonas sp. SE-A11]